MAEKAAVFGRVVVREWRNTIFIMAFGAEFLRLFFLHIHELLMLFVVGEPGRGFGWCAPEKKKEAHAENDKKAVVYHYLLFAVHYAFSIL